MNSQNQQQIQELHLSEHNLQSLQYQKQTFQIELNEISNAISELGKTKDDVYRVTSGILIKTEKNILEKELNERKKIVELRIDSIDKQENLTQKRIDELKNTILK